MKSRILFSLAALIAAAAIVFSAGCTKEIEVTGISLDTASLNMVIGETHMLVPTVEPENAAAPEDVVWESRNTAVADVSEDGLVTAIAKGSTQIVARCGSVSTVCNVAVSGGDVTSVSVVPDKLSLKKNETAKLSVTIVPETADHDGVVWESSDPSLASVDAEGTVTALMPGNVTVTATCGGLSAECKVTVLRTEAESVTLDKTSLEMNPGDSYSLTATVAPEGADVVLKWISSDSFVASVDDNGKVVANRSGKAVIKVSAGKLSAECEVVVNKVGPEVGDYYYSDGTYSTEFDESKTAIGLIFWTGDPSEHDPLMGKEHPECKNGLVIALKGYAKSKQMTTQQRSAYMQAYPQYRGSVSSWAAEHAPQFESVLTGRELNSNLNRRVGYHNTKVFEAFNAAEENAEWPLTIVGQLEEYRSLVPVPENTSGWYIPSCKELSLFVTGNYDGNISEINGAFTQVEQGRRLCEILSNTPGAEPIPTDAMHPYGGRHWTSQEVPFLGDPSMNLITIVSLTDGASGSDRSDFSNYTRFILAF